MGFFIKRWGRIALVVAINIVPMISLNLLPWIIAAAVLILAIFTYAQIPYYAVWIWATVDILQRPFTWFHVLFFVCMAVCTVSTIGTTIMLFKPKDPWR